MMTISNLAVCTVENQLNSNQAFGVHIILKVKPHWHNMEPG
jgi:hypothetical protein